MHEALTVGKSEGATPLYVAAQEGRLPVVQYLMEVVRGWMPVHAGLTCESFPDAVAVQTSNLNCCTGT